MPYTVGMEGLPHYERQERPWGVFERFTLNDPSTVKIITVHAGQQLSLQRHAHRDESWRMLAGSGTVTVGEHTTEVKPGDDFFVARGQQHRVKGGPQGLVFLEIALGQFDEADIKRLADDYGRA